MSPSENCYDGVPLQPLWLSLVRRVGVATGALVALTALLVHAPLHVAALRGGLAWLAVVLCGRAVGWLSQRTTPSAPAAGAPTTGPGPDPDAGSAA